MEAGAFSSAAVSGVGHSRARRSSSPMSLSSWRDTRGHPISAGWVVAGSARRSPLGQQISPNP